MLNNSEKSILIDDNINSKGKLEYSSYLDFMERCFVTSTFLYGVKSMRISEYKPWSLSI